MENIVKNINDFYKFTIEAFITGDLFINSAIENIDGETANRFFEKRYKYSFDGVNYSDWYLVSNIQNEIYISGNSDSIIFITFIYTRKGTDTTGDLIFNSLELVGNVTIQLNSYDTTVNSIFSEIINKNFYTKSIRNNLLRKVYNSGILPKFIERNGDYQDKDFISFWGTICEFFALISTFAEDFDNIPFNSKNLRRYLEQENIALNKDMTLVDIQNISSNLLKNLRVRGTIMTVKEKGYMGSEVDGEWLRLISYDKYNDDFIIDFERKKDNGYYLNQSSVIYPGTFRDNKQIEKYGGSFLGSSNIPSFLNPDGTLIIQKDVSFLKYLMKVEKDIDYIFEFEINKNQGVLNFNVGLACYNSDGFLIKNSLQNCKDGTDKDYFLNEEITTLKSAGSYFIKCILFNENYDFTEKNELNINQGNNLKQKSSIFNSVALIMDNPENLISVNVRPLLKGWNINRQKNPQFLQSFRFINNYRKNNNNHKDEDYVNVFLSRYLIPYQYKLNSIEIGLAEKTYEAPSNPIIPIIPYDKRIFNNAFNNFE